MKLLSILINLRNGQHTKIARDKPNAHDVSKGRLPSATTDNHSTLDDTRLNFLNWAATIPSWIAIIHRRDRKIKAGALARASVKIQQNPRRN